MRFWQVAEGSNTAHIIDTDRPSWHNPDGSRRRCGPRSECGRYPQRNADGTWFEMSVDDAAFDRVARHYMLRVCQDCRDKGKPPSPESGEPASPPRQRTRGHRRTLRSREHSRTSHRTPTERIMP